MTYTQRVIAEIADAHCLTLDPRHVEAWMRSDHDTLSHLEDEVFRAYAHMTANATPEYLAILEQLAQAEGF